MPHKEEVMPKGKGHQFTEKQDRQAQHIQKSEEQSGKSAKESERIAYATINKQKSGKGKK